jgi:hypothetical protein
MVTAFSAVAGIPILLAMRTTLFFTLLVFVGYARPAEAQQYGWPPPNYSVTGVGAEDGSHYRNLRQVLHDRGWGWRLRARKAIPEGAIEQPAAARLLVPMTTPPLTPNQPVIAP